MTKDNDVPNSWRSPRVTDIGRIFTTVPDNRGVITYGKIIAVELRPREDGVGDTKVAWILDDRSHQFQFSDCKVLEKEGE